MVSRASRVRHAAWLLFWWFLVAWGGEQTRYSFPSEADCQREQSIVMQSLLGLLSGPIMLMPAIRVTPCAWSEPERSM